MPRTVSVLLNCVDVLLRACYIAAIAGNSTGDLKVALRRPPARRAGPGLVVATTPASVLYLEIVDHITEVM